MSEDHPLSLVEQVTPIIDLMARTSSHFARLRDFVTLKFPPGFPVKIGTEGFGCAVPFIDFKDAASFPSEVRSDLLFFLSGRNPPVSRSERPDHLWKRE